MKSQFDFLDYNDFDAIVAKARMERSVAVGNAIAGFMALVMNGTGRAFQAAKSAVAGPKTEAGLEVPAHR